MKKETVAGKDAGLMHLSLVKRVAPKKDLYEFEKLEDKGRRSIVTSSVISNNLISNNLIKGALSESLESSKTFPFLPAMDSSGWIIPCSSPAVVAVMSRPAEQQSMFTLGQSLLGGSADEIHLVSAFFEGGLLKVIAYRDNHYLQCNE